jgi:hypothetical protein
MKQNVSTVGIDLAKRIFHLVGTDTTVISPKIRVTVQLKWAGGSFDPPACRPNSVGLMTREGLETTSRDSSSAV